jgi:F-type H+-transporting ATPase subunit alpha
LIVGDRQTGKTSVAIDTIINQRDKDVVCVYCAIGQRGTAVARVVDTLRKHKALDNTIIVVASDDDTPGLRYVTPYAATSMAEYFMERGKDTLIVYDDLTRHARAYRELSLLLRRPPGREAYPGDIFYIHSRLLERSTHLNEKQGGGSLTALPIIETQAQDISAYIPTNLISITDGQIYLSPTLFHKGMLPAIDIGKSISRVGGKTQYPAFRSVAGDLRLAYTQFEELETFARFATRLDDHTRKTIEHGRRVREVLKQSERRPLSAAQQMIVLKVVNSGLLDTLPLDLVEEAESAIQKRVSDELPDLWHSLQSGEKLEETQWQKALELATQVVSNLTQQA